MKIYRVGGAVRDQLLNLANTDSDWVVVGATPEEMVEKGFKPVGKAFPVFLHPQTKEEYALARTERKTAPGYKGFVFHATPDVTLEEDLRRRDLTINAMARDEDGTIVDPYGGQADLNAKILRHVSPAFAEDPVRILRVARFAARFAPLGFRIAEETRNLMRAMVDNGEVDALVAERVWNETERALGEDKPSVFFITLRACGALAHVYPEIECLFGVPQRADHHPEIDTGVHTMMVLDRAAELSTSVGVRFAALVHDLGKGETPADILPRHIGHEERSLPIIERLCKRLRVPNEMRDLGKIVARYHGLCHRIFELRTSTILALLTRIDALRRPERFAAFLLACQADSQGRLGKENQPYPQADFLRGAYQAMRDVDTAALTRQGLAAKELGQAIAAERRRAIAQLRKDWDAAAGHQIAPE